MANPSKAKGTRFESEVVQVFRNAGFPHVERRALAGNLDKGDISGIPWLVVECKAAKTMELGPWMTETAQEALNAHAYNYLLVVKRRMYPAAQAFAVMPLCQAIGWARSLDALP